MLAFPKQHTSYKLLRDDLTKINTFNKDVFIFISCKNIYACKNSKTYKIYSFRIVELIISIPVLYVFIALADQTTDYKLRVFGRLLSIQN
ncbi:hypothetical protein FHX64_000792 [Microbacter margulisiae]|uniref:Uncharacterized protein n=1 Tax=Microbacter margulisiae TaxID=1350067 RepID=A0A7W5DPC8_9PORP|nr:hypothetical protein [Microbacter margulisiae]